MNWRKYCAIARTVMIVRISCGGRVMQSSHACHLNDGANCALRSKQLAIGLVLGNKVRLACT